MNELIRGPVEERFPDPPPGKPTYKLFPSILSIASLIFMSTAADYMRRMLERPDFAYHLILAPEHEHAGGVLNRFHHNTEATHPVASTIASFLEETVCFFPDVLYKNTTTAKFFSECNKANLDLLHEDPQVQAEWWTLLPFYFTIYGATLGWLFEIYLLLIGHAFQQNLNHFTTWISRLRLLNLAFVGSTIFFFSAALVVPSENHPFLKFLFYLSVFMLAVLAPGLYWGGFRIRGGIDALPPTLLLIQASQFVFVITRKTVAGGNFAKYALALNPVFQFTAFLVTTATPMKSFGFHMLSTIAGIWLYIAIMLAASDDPSLPENVGNVISNEDIPYVRNWPFIVATLAAGFVGVMKTFPMLFESFRSEISYTLWSLIYFVLVGNPSPPAPKRLAEVYHGSPPQRVTLQPYSQSHPYQVAPNMAIPAIAGELPQTIEENAGSLLQKITKLFGLISKMDRFTPQANVNTPLEYKVRLAPSEDGQDRYPSTLFSLPLFDFPAMGKTLQRAPQPAVDSFKEGQLLSYLCQWGIGNTFLQIAKETTSYPFFELCDSGNDDSTGLVLDFRTLEEFENKEDYEPYGGVAFFEIDSKKCLLLKWVVAPRATYKIIVNKKSGTFRRAEAMILSTLYFSVVAGKHLAEIHMSYNLLEVANINIFDVSLNERAGGPAFNGHPIRVMLYIHLFSHGLAEELTTEHLVQQGAVFSQIFALKYEALVDYLTSRYNQITYASDEDFAYREQVNQAVTGTNASYLVSFDMDRPPVPNALTWEQQYYSIFWKYASTCMQAIYDKSDENVANDQTLQKYFTALEQVFREMPARYDCFKTVKGVTTFIADSINHLVIRHQLYGTTAVASVMDPRLGSTQTPKDGGQPAVDEWRSLGYVALATAYANFVHILEDDPDRNDGPPLNTIFEDATPVLPGRDKAVLVNAMKGAWKQLQLSLRALQDEWVTDLNLPDTDEAANPRNYYQDVNYMYFRPVPKDCHTGPGY